MLKKIILWILIILWMSAIFLFSSQQAKKSDATSTGFTKKVVSIIDINDSLSEKEIENIAAKINNVVRKCAHFSAYALLAFLLGMLVKEYKFSGVNAFFLPVMISWLYACSDEFHQTFVNGRSGEIRDVAIDTLGAICGVCALWLLRIIKTKFLKR